MNVTSQYPIHAGWVRENPSLNDRMPSVPWVLLAPHEMQAERNHGQTLERLAERGGLSPCEMIAIIDDQPLDLSNMDEAAAVDRLIVLIGTGAAR
jgi:hypothetical protein